MTSIQKYALGFAASRIAYAGALLIAPGRAGGPWLGAPVATGGGRVAARALAIRDGALGAGVAMAALSGTPMRPWLAACVVSDLTDAAATVIDRESLPRHAAPATVGVAGGAAAAGAALLATAVA